MLGFGRMRIGAAPSCIIDVNAASRSFFLRGRGTNGATPATDELGNALTWSGAAVITTAQSLWPQYGSGITVPSSGVVVGPTGKLVFPADFTVRVRAKLGTYTSLNTLIADPSTGGFGVFASGDTSLTVTKANVANIINAVVPSLSAAIRDIEVGRSGSTVYLFVDGALITSATDSTTFTSGAINIGGNTADTSRCWNGILGDVTIHPGVCLHTSSFNTQSAPPC